MTCAPADRDSGIVFFRSDLPTLSGLPARVEAVADVTRGVTLGAKDGVRTVEHLLAAAAGLGITNLRATVHGHELPALDGSAAPYCSAFAQAGIEVQPGHIEPMAIRAPVWVTRASSWMLALPAQRFRVTYIVPLPSARLGIQVADVELDGRRFLEEIAPARTWGSIDELRTLQAEGLALGASEENALGIGPQGYSSAPRFPDEPARHKVLDLIGDLALLGRPLQAHVIAFGAGHALHIELVRRLYDYGS